MRLIDADELKKKFEYSGEWYKSRTVMQIIDRALTVEAYTKDDMTREYLKGYNACKDMNERPQGEWKHWGSPFSDEQVANSIVCSVCGARFVEIQDEVFNFCPKCGADMRGEEE